MYHRIESAPPGAEAERAALYCSRRRFLEHLEMLGSLGYRAITLRELDAGLCGRGTLPRHPVVLTFDDGTADHNEVGRLLERHHMKGVSFVVPGFCGRRRYLTREEIRALHRRGMEIGSHSLSHRVLRELSWEEKASEIALSARLLEQLLGLPVTSFCFPGGVFDQQSSQLVRRFGYRFARTTISGVDETPAPNLRLRCLHAHEQTTGAELLRLMESQRAEPCPICGI